jgi:hypothetical protein
MLPATIRTWSKMLDPSSPSDQIKASLRSMLAGYVGITDTWGTVFTPELLEMYPDALVICTIRDPDAWWKSLGDLTGNAPSPLFMKILLWPVPVFRVFPGALEKLWSK